MSGLRILVVEDDPGSREALRALLEILGHEVDEAATGDRAIVLAARRPPDLILMDVGLPDLDGHETARRIRGAPGGDDIHMVAFTGHHRSTRPAASAFDGYLMKPVALEDIEELLAVAAAARANAAAADGSHDGGDAQPRPTRPVLVVEDDEAFREAIVVALEHDGYRVVAAGHGREALDLLHAGLDPCVIVLDLMMAVMDGWEFRRAQLSDTALAGIPVVVVSAHHEARKLGASHGVSGVLQKPVDPDDLLALVASACRR